MHNTKEATTTFDTLLFGVQRKKKINCCRMTWKNESKDDKKPLLFDLFFKIPLSLLLAESFATTELYHMAQFF